jgi:hypothetical protein
MVCGVALDRGRAVGSDATHETLPLQSVTDGLGERDLVFHDEHSRHRRFGSIVGIKGRSVVEWQ